MKKPVSKLIISYEGEDKKLELITDSYGSTWNKLLWDFIDFLSSIGFNIDKEDIEQSIGREL